jgi:hypothetical protein
MADLAGVRAPVLRLETQENKGGSGVLTLLRSRGGQRGWQIGGVEGDRGGGGIPAEEGDAVRSDGEEEEFRDAGSSCERRGRQSKTRRNHGLVHRRRGAPGGR